MLLRNPIFCEFSGGCGGAWGPDPLDPRMVARLSWAGLINNLILVRNCNSNRERPAQFENRIKPRVYVRCISKKVHFVRRNLCKENEFCGMFKIHCFDKLEPFFNRI